MDIPRIPPHNPTVRYGYDPGEPFVHLSSKARQTNFVVTTQEQRNRTRLARSAIARGEKLVRSTITYTPTLEGNLMTLQSGLTTVVSRNRQVQGISSVPHIKPADSNMDSAPTQPGLDFPVYSPVVFDHKNNTTEQTTPQQLQQRSSELERVEYAMKAQIVNIDMRIRMADDEAQIRQLVREKEQIEQKIEAIDQAKSSVTQALVQQEMGMDLSQSQHVGGANGSGVGSVIDLTV